MSKKDYIQRYIFIINRLKSRASTFEELQDYLLMYCIDPRSPKSPDFGFFYLAKILKDTCVDG
jgi:hypothetical protein